MAGRGNVSLRFSSLADDQLVKALRYIAPIVTWLVGLPVGVLTFSTLRDHTRHPTAVSVLMLAMTAVVSWWMWRITSSRSTVGRWHHTLNAAGCLGWITLTVTFGWRGLSDYLLYAYTIGGLTGVIMWMIRYTTHVDAVADVMPTKAVKGRPVVDFGAAARLIAERVPNVQKMAEAASQVVPALADPWRNWPALEAGPAAHDDNAMAEAEAAMAAILRNWADFTRDPNKAPKLKGARMIPITVHPWRIHTEIRGKRGVHTPDDFESVRALWGSQNDMSPGDIMMTPKPKSGASVYMDFILVDTLKDARTWPGPQYVGKSIGDGALRFGRYEDNGHAERFGPAITGPMAKKLGLKEKNLKHLVGEGMTGSGKSTFTRIDIADAATRLDVVDWAIDTVKKLQTLGCVSQALDWFATAIPEANAMVSFLVAVIGARSAYLGERGLDNWEPGCGLPYLRVRIEEGNIIANELENLADVLNSARSAGVEIGASFQRVHHAVVDTNARAAFGDTMSYGVKDIGDIFVLDEDLLAAGANPSQWKSDKPGMMYWDTDGIPLERKIMGVRCDIADVEYLAALCAQYVPTRDAWIREHCPDWFTMLDALDARFNGVYSTRQTGASVRATLDASQARRSGGTTVTLEKVAPDTTNHLNTPALGAPTGKVVAGAVVDPVRDAANAVAETLGGADAYEGDPPMTAAEMEIPADLLAELAEDDVPPGVTVRTPIPEEPDDGWTFPRPAVAEKYTQDEAVGMVRRYLMSRGVGFEFAPKDLYVPLCGEFGDGPLGRKPSWIRAVALAQLKNDGFLVHHRGTATYSVAEKAPQLVG